MKRTKHKNRVLTIFSKYSKSKDYLTRREMNLLLKKEYGLRYSKEVINSLMSIWGTSKGSGRVITQSTFPKLYQGPDGFLRDFN